MCVCHNLQLLGSAAITILSCSLAAYSKCQYHPRTYKHPKTLKHVHECTTVRINFERKKENNMSGSAVFLTANQRVVGSSRTKDICWGNWCDLASRWMFVKRCSQILFETWNRHHMANTLQSLLLCPQKWGQTVNTQHNNTWICAGVQPVSWGKIDLE